MKPKLPAKTEKKKPKEKELVIREDEPRGISHEDYYEANEDKKEPTVKHGKPEKALSTKHLLRIIVLLFLSVFLLIMWLNRDNFSPENLGTWFKTKIMGAGVGDGFPVPLTGTSASSGNFFDSDGNCVVMSDTSLSVLNSTGREIFSYRHSYNNPAISGSQGKYLLYNIGGTGFSLVSPGRDTQKKVAPDKISLGALAKNGRYALSLQSPNYASQLNVYLPGGTLKATYKFAEGYASGLAINSDCTGGMLSTILSENGKLYSKLYVYDFNKEEPVATYTTENNVITEIGYHQNGSYYAVGDKKLVHMDPAGVFSEYDYSGKNLTATSLDSETILISVSSYPRNGACTILVFTGSATPTVLQTDDHVSDLSAYATVFAALIGDQV
ncbi:MAG: DUF5711 family protein, partial [Oscillospiraceae bacterium]